jgi:hypothetical protein
MLEAKPEWEEAIMGECEGRKGCGLHLLNTTICPSGADGAYTVQTVALETALHLYRYLVSHGLDPYNHVGHAAACQAFEALGFGHMEPDRTPWDGFGLGLCLQLRGRIAEGAILSRAEMEEMGYDLRLIFRPPNVRRGLDGVVQWALKLGIGRNDAWKAVEVFRDLGATSRTEIRPWVDEEDELGRDYPAVRTRPA